MLAAARLPVSDAVRRELERQARAGDRDARGQLLRERARDGALSPERLALGAALGSQAAAAALGRPPACLPLTPEALAEWLRGLAAFGKPVVVRAGIAAARIDAGLRLAKPFPNEIPEAIDLAERWLEAGALPPPDYPWCSPCTIPDHILAALASDDAAAAAEAVARIPPELFAAEPERVAEAVARELLPWALDEDEAAAG